MKNVNSGIEKLLSYGEQELFLSPEGKAFARNRLLELLQTEPSYEEPDEEDIEEILDELTIYAVENGIVDEELADKFPDKLMNIVMPSQDDAAHTYSRLHRDRGREAAEEYFLHIMKAGRYVRKPENKPIGWYTTSDNGDFAVVIPYEDRAVEEGGFYPKCPYCLENLGFCGLPGEPSFYTKRTLPFELNGERWHFSYLSSQIFEDEFVVATQKHRPAGESRSIAVMADMAEKVPSGFVGTTYEKQEHEHLFGGKRVLPIFKRPIKKTLIDGDYQVSVLDWFFSALRVKCYIKKDLVKVISKLVKYWKDYAEGNVVYPAVYCTDEGYIADIVFLKKSEPTPIFEKPDYLSSLGLFVLPASLKKDIYSLICALGEKKVDFGQINESPELGKYLEWVIQIAAARGAELTKDKARSSLVSMIGETCIHAAKDSSVNEKTLENIFKESLGKLNLREG